MGLRVLVYDTTQTGWPPLSALWRTGALISGADVVIPASGWADAYDALAEIDRPVDQLQVWGHGYPGQPLINGRSVDLVQLSQSLRTIHPRTEVWFRACDVAMGQSGHTFMRAAVARLKCTVVAHCAVVAWPNPAWQAQICALRPGEDVWWSLSGDELRGCSTFRMTVPAHAYRDWAR